MNMIKEHSCKNAAVFFCENRSVAKKSYRLPKKAKKPYNDNDNNNENNIDIDNDNEVVAPPHLSPASNKEKIRFMRVHRQILIYLQA